MSSVFKMRSLEKRQKDGHGGAVDDEPASAMDAWAFADLLATCDRLGVRLTVAAAHNFDMLHAGVCVHRLWLRVDARADNLRAFQSALSTAGYLTESPPRGTQPRGVHLRHGTRPFLYVDVAFDYAAAVAWQPQAQPAVQPAVAPLAQPMPPAPVALPVPPPVAAPVSPFVAAPVATPAPVLEPHPAAPITRPLFTLVPRPVDPDEEPTDPGRPAWNP